MIADFWFSRQPRFIAEGFTCSDSRESNLKNGSGGRSPLLSRSYTRGLEESDMEKLWDPVSMIP